jgi:hypothetical protein
MKTVILSVAIILAVITANSQVTKEIYGVKSGYVEYELSGNAEGTKKLWWDNYGAKTRTEIQSKVITKMFGITQETITNSVEIKNGDTYCTVDLNEMTGQESSIEELMDYSEYEEMTDKEKEDFAQAMLDNLGGEKLPSEIFLGCQCDVISLWGSKIWTYKSVPLKIESNVMGIINNETATVFEKNITVHASKFDKPEGIEYTQIGNYMDMLDQYDDYEYYDED